MIGAMAVEVVSTITEVEDPEVDILAIEEVIGMEARVEVVEVAEAGMVDTMTMKARDIDLGPTIKINPNNQLILRLPPRNKTPSLLKSPLVIPKTKHGQLKNQASNQSHRLKTQFQQKLWRNPTKQEVAKNPHEPLEQITSSKQSKMIPTSAQIGRVSQTKTGVS